MDISQDDLHSELISSSGLSGHIDELEYTWEVDGYLYDGRFFYIRLHNEKPITDDFVDFLYSRLIDFCLPNKELDEVKKKGENIGHTAAYTRALEKAKSLFIELHESNSSHGEPGELVLYVLLEMVLDAPQIVAKMSLKTSTNMPVHGADGIHAKYLSENDQVCLLWGESKLYGSFPSALREAISSTNKFIEYEDDGKKRDIDIVRDYISLSNPRLREDLVKIFDPYNDKFKDYDEVYVCLICFTFEAYAESRQSDSNTADTFIDKYSDRIESSQNLIEKHLSNYNMNNINLKFLLLPFEDVDHFRNSILGKIKS